MRLRLKHGITKKSKINLENQPRKSFYEFFFLFILLMTFNYIQSKKMLTFTLEGAKLLKISLVHSPLFIMSFEIYAASINTFQKKYLASHSNLRDYPYLLLSSTDPPLDSNVLCSIFHRLL